MSSDNRPSSNTRSSNRTNRTPYDRPPDENVERSPSPTKIITPAEKTSTNTRTTGNSYIDRSGEKLSKKDKRHEAQLTKTGPKTNTPTSSPPVYMPLDSSFTPPSNQHAALTSTNKTNNNNAAVTPPQLPPIEGIGADHNVDVNQQTTIQFNTGSAGLEPPIMHNDMHTIEDIDMHDQTNDASSDFTGQTITTKTLRASLTIPFNKEIPNYSVKLLEMLYRHKISPSQTINSRKKIYAEQDDINNNNENNKSRDPESIVYIATVDSKVDFNNLLNLEIEITPDSPKLRFTEYYDRISQQKINNESSRARTIQVFNISVQTKKSNVVALFNTFGEIEDSHFVRNKTKQNS